MKRMNGNSVFRSQPDEIQPSSLEISNGQAMGLPIITSGVFLVQISRLLANPSLGFWYDLDRMV